MVRKIKIFCGLLAVCGLLSFMTLTAAAAEPYADGNISSTYTAIFEDIANTIPVNSDYVMYRSGQYEYKMYVGDLTYSTNSILGSSLTCYTISTNQGSSYQSGRYIYEVSENQSLTLNVGTYLVYTNLGNYPNFIERGDYIETASLFALCIASMCYIVTRIFSFCLRIRR